MLNDVRMAVVIPPDYSRLIVSGKQANVQLLVDGSDSNTASIALGYAESVVRLYSAELRTDVQNRKAGLSGAGQNAPSVDPMLRVWYNSRLESKNYVVPGLIAVILMIIGSVLTSMTIAREWEMGTMEQLLSTPLRPTELVLGKMMAYFAVGMVDLAISVACGVYVFDVPLRGSFLLLVGTSCLFLLGTLFWGIYLSAATRTQLAAYQLAMLSSFLPAFMLSELKRAFEIGFLIFVPFLVIDMAIASILMSMGMMMLPPIVISLPFKLIFFVLVDGWRMVAGSLVASYGVGVTPQ